MKLLSKFIKKISCLPQDHTASVMVEGALILPIFITILAMCIELSMLATAKFAVNYAAYAACRAGIVYNGKADVMKEAAAMALSPVTQASPNAVYLGKSRKEIEWEVAKSMKYGCAEIESFKLKSPGNPTLTHFLIGFATALLHFEEGISKLEYIAEGWSGASLGPINEIRRLNPDPTVSKGKLEEKALNFDEAPFKNYVEDNLWTEKGKQEKGIAFTNPDAAKYLRLRIQVRHSHKLLFPFLKMFFKGWHALPWKHDPETLPSELNSLEIDRIVLSSVCTMRMQSNLMVNEK